jgi:hypothetical protein
MIAAEKPHQLGRREQHRNRPGNAERLGRGGPAKYSTRTVVEFRGNGVQLVLSERGQIGVPVQVLAQQSVRILVGAALPWVVVVSLVIADSSCCETSLTSSWRSMLWSMAQKVVSMEAKLLAVFSSGVPVKVTALCRRGAINSTSFRAGRSTPARDAHA